MWEMRRLLGLREDGKQRLVAWLQRVGEQMSLEQV